MICPGCGKEMKKGRMTAGGYHIRWVPEGESTALSFFSDNVVSISGFSLSSKGVSAHICQACRKVIADY